MRCQLVCAVVERCVCLPPSGLACSVYRSCLIFKESRISALVEPSAPDARRPVRHRRWADGLRVALRPYGVTPPVAGPFAGVTGRLKTAVRLPRLRLVFCLCVVACVWPLVVEAESERRAVRLRVCAPVRHLPEGPPPPPGPQRRRRRHPSPPCATARRGRPEAYPKGLNEGPPPPPPIQVTQRPTRAP